MGVTGGTQLGQPAALETTVMGMRRRGCLHLPGHLQSPEMWEATPSPSSKSWGRTLVSGGHCKLRVLWTYCLPGSSRQGLEPPGNHRPQQPFKVVHVPWREREARPGTRGTPRGTLSPHSKPRSCLLPPSH